MGEMDCSQYTAAGRVSEIRLTGHLVCATADEAAMVLRHLGRHIELTRAEAGCVHFEVEATDDPLVWAVVERFVDRIAFDSHQARVRTSEWGRATSDIKRDYVIEAVAGDSRSCLLDQRVALNDFVDYEPGARRAVGTTSVAVRAATPEDVPGLAVVMSVRGGAVEDHLDRAHRLFEQLPVLLVAEDDGGIVGWSGAQRFPINPGEEPEWLVAGLTVVPDQRCRGIGALLLRDVLQTIRRAEPDEPVFSVINARNPASIDLHEGLGFREVSRAATLARIEFTGGEGVLLRYEWF